MLECYAIIDTYIESIMNLTAFDCLTGKSVLGEYDKYTNTRCCYNGEGDHEICSLKTDKTRGLDGLCPTVFKVLSVNWIVTLTPLFNLIVTVTPLFNALVVMLSHGEL